MSEIRRVRVDWHEGWANSPSFQVLFDRMSDDVRYMNRNASYLATDGDLARFYAYTKPGQGFGGARFPITMMDGEKRELIGPWSSNSDEINTDFPEIIVLEAHVTDDPKVFERGHTYYAGAVTLEGLIQWMVKHHKDIDFGIALVQRYYGCWLEPTKGSFVKCGANESVTVLQMFTPAMAWLTTPTPEAVRDDADNFIEFVRAHFSKKVR